MEKLIEFFGGPTALATALGVSYEYVWMLSNNKRQFSPALAMKAERLTNGVVSKSILRPDLWPETDQAAA